MKNLSIILAITVSSLNMFAQNQGTIQYEEKDKLEFHFEGNAPPPPNMPTEVTNNTLLYFNNDASLYKSEGNTADQSIEEEDGEDGRFIMRMDMPQMKIYSDLKDKKIIRQEDFMQRTFLIESEMGEYSWKLTGKQKMILNYPCQEATLIDTSRNVTAWFTPAFPVSVGPMLFNGLPGLILEINIDNGMRTITATNISKELNADMIEKPKDGKKVTGEEFEKIVADKMKEMGVEGDGGNQVIIKIND